MAVQFRWDGDPLALATALDGWEQNVLSALGELADYFAGTLEAYAKANAPWTDRTSNARQGLRGEAEKLATAVVIYLIHTEDYGVFLELGTKYMTPRAIIGPTMESHYAEIMAAVEALVR